MPSLRAERMILGLMLISPNLPFGMVGSPEPPVKLPPQKPVDELPVWTMRKMPEHERQMQTPYFDFGKT